MAIFTRVYTENEKLKFFTGLLFSGIGFIYFPIHMGYLGALLIFSATVGFSTTVSASLENPHYNLWKHIKDFAPHHKFLISCMLLGIVMLNPLVTLVAALIGRYVDKNYSEQLTRLEKLFTLTFNNLKFDTIKTTLKTYLGKSISFNVGALGGLLASLWFLPSLFNFLIKLNVFHFKVISMIAWRLTANVTGGFVPSLLLLSATLPTFGLLSFLAPSLLFGLVGGIATYKVWQKIHAAVLFSIDKFKKFTMAFQERFANIRAKFQKKKAPEQPIMIKIENKDSQNKIEIALIEIKKDDSKNEIAIDKVEKENANELASNTVFQEVKPVTHLFNTVRPQVASEAKEIDLINNQSDKNKSENAKTSLI